MRIRPLLGATLTLVGLLCPGGARAQELFLLGGSTHDTGGPDSSYAWSASYAQGFGEHAFVTIGWLNEGHLLNHHRDGPVAQLWGRWNLVDRRLSLALGAGPYSFFDTAKGAADAAHADEHGRGIIYSAGVTWYGIRRWIVQARANLIQTESYVDTTMFLLGAGYQLDAPDRPGPRPHAPRLERKTTANEVSVLVGRAILNTFESEGSTAFAAEYRRGLGRYVDGTVGWLHEGDAEIVRRHGLTAQAWLVRPFLNDRLTLGAGAGAEYILDEENRDGGEDEGGAVVLTMTASYRFDPDWLARLSWYRVRTNHDRDSDVIVLGAGYRF